MSSDSFYNMNNSAFCEEEAPLKYHMSTKQSQNAA